MSAASCLTFNTIYGTKGHKELCCPTAWLMTNYLVLSMLNDSGCTKMIGHCAHTKIVLSLPNGGGEGMWICWQSSRQHYSLHTNPLQQEVAAEAALTLVPNTVVLAVHTHSVLLRRTLRHPFLNLLEKRRQISSSNSTMRAQTALSTEV